MRRADHMKPLCAASDTEPRLVQMLHTRARRRKRLYMPGCRTQARRSPAAHRPQRRRRHTRPEQNLQHLTQPALRKKLRMTQPNRQRRKTGPILNRTRHPLRKRPPRHSSATSAAAGMAAMLRNLQRTRLRKVEYLARNRRPLTSRSQKRPTAAPAYLRNVIHRTVRDRRPAQRMTLVTRLAPRLAARPTAKAPRPTLRAEASSTRRSTEADRCSRCSDPNGAPTPIAAPQEPRSAREARRSPPPDARSSLPEPPCQNPENPRATNRNDPWTG